MLKSITPPKSNSAKMVSGTLLRMGAPVKVPMTTPAVDAVIRNQRFKISRPCVILA